MEAMLRFGFARRFNDDLLDLWVHAFPFPPSFIPCLFSFVSSGSNHYGDSPNNIRLYQEERVERDFGLTGLYLQLNWFLSGTGECQLLGQDVGILEFLGFMLDCRVYHGGTTCSYQEQAIDKLCKGGTQ